MKRPARAGRLPTTRVVQRSTPILAFRRIACAGMGACSARYSNWFARRRVSGLALPQHVGEYVGEARACRSELAVYDRQALLAVRRAQVARTLTHLVGD